MQKTVLGDKIACMDSDLQAQLTHEAKFMVCDKGKCLDIDDKSRVTIIVLQGELEIYYQGVVKMEIDYSSKNAEKLLSKEFNKNKFEKAKESKLQEPKNLLISKYPFFLPDTEISSICNKPSKSLLAMAIACLINSQISDHPIPKRHLADTFAPYNSPLLLKRLSKNSKMISITQNQHFDGKTADLSLARCFRSAAVVVVRSSVMADIVYRDAVRKDRLFRDIVGRFAVFERLASYGNLERFRAMFVETRVGFKDLMYVKGEQCRALFILIGGEANLYRNGLPDQKAARKNIGSMQIDDPGKLATKSAYRKIARDPEPDPPSLKLTLKPYSMMGSEFLPSLQTIAAKYDQWNNPEQTQEYLLSTINLTYHHTAQASTASKVFKISIGDIFTILTIFNKNNSVQDYNNRIYQWQNRFDLVEHANQIAYGIESEEPHHEKSIKRRNKIDKKVKQLDKSKPLDAKTMTAIKALDSAIKARRLDVPVNNLESTKLVPSNHIARNLCNSQK